MSHGPDACAACGRGPLRPHLRVAGAAGAEGLIPTTLAFGTALGDIVRCAACGHMQLSPLPAAETLAGAYAEAESGDYLAEAEGQRATARRVLDRLTRRLPPGSERPRVLDVGCWLGFLLDEARRRGWETVGLEPSRYASSYAREVLGLDVRTADLRHAQLEGERFDAIVMGDVIEHLLDPGAVLDQLAGLSAPGALLYLALPDAGSRLARVLGRRWWSVIPTHVQYFTRRSITLLLSRHGWEPLELRTAPKVFSVAYYLSRVEGYQPRAARLAVASARAWGLADRLVAPDFRDRMGVLARRAPAPPLHAAPAPARSSTWQY